MQAKNNILSIEQSNRNMLRHYSKSCNRSENRHLIYSANKDAAAFTEALKAAYPELPGDADALAQALYKK